MRWTVFAWLVVAYGCGIECSEDDRSGIYRISYTEESGDCGPIDDAVQRLDEPPATSLVCQVSHDEWTEDQCGHEISIYCESAADDISGEVIGKTTQDDEDGAEITGTMSMRLFQLSTGVILCGSVYKMRAKRL